MRIVAAAVSVAVLGLSVLFAPAQRQDDDQPQRFWVKVVFGLDQKPAKWDGRLTIKNGRVFSMAEWGLEARDELNAESMTWKIQAEIPKARRVTFAEPLRGFLFEVEATSESTVAIETQQGRIQFQPRSLVAGRPSQFLDGRATVERLGTGTVVADTTTDDDFTSIAVDSRGNRHVSWIAFDNENQLNHLLIRNVDGATDDFESISKQREFANAHLFAFDDVLRAVWCSPGDDQNWDIYTAIRTKDGWNTDRLTKADGTDFHLAAAQGADGTLWLTWQSFRNGNGDIFAKCLRHGKWSGDIAVTDDPADEWQPSVSVDGDGRAWIAYDSYQNGNYDIYATRVGFDGKQHRVDRPTAVATSLDFEAHATVLAEADRVWVAYDAAGPNWGKDFRNVPTINKGKYAEPLHASRRLEMRCLIDGVVFRPSVALPQKLPPDRIPAIERTSAPKPTKPTRFYEYPQLARDGDGRMWLFFRQCRQGYCPHPPKGHHWNLYATSFTSKGWLEPIQLPRSQGRQNQRVSFAVGPTGRLECAWADGNRFASVDRKYVALHGTLPKVIEKPADLPLEEIELDEPGSTASAPKVPWTIERDGKEYHLYFGDLHRHTNISRCAPTIDGCLTDAHRYALNAVELDFLAITDHTRDVNPFAWWRTQQAVDLFHIPGRYIPIYAYERSNDNAGGGHRNVFFLNRGQEVSRSDHWYMGRGLPRRDANPDTTLYPWMKERGGALTAAHTPAYSAAAKRGTWTYNDPQVEPVAEVFQGFRRSYVRPGKSVREEASVWYALRKGHRLGFIASSDHISTHQSYACIWATEKTREALFEGLQARRTFAATDRIALDVRIGNALMGEELAHEGSEIAVQIRAVTTAPVQEIEVVRSGQVIGKLHPRGRDVDTRFVDKKPLPGKSYYYIRLEQEDGGLAWGSPIWVKR